MRHFLPLLLIGLGGCSLPALGTSLDDYADTRYGGVGGYYQGYGEPLRATVWFDEYTGYASFDLNRQAHVAMFALQPMGGLQMIYPAIGYGARQRFSAGSHVVNTWSSRYGYAGARSMYGGSRYGGSTPTYILLIASDRPLDVGSFMATGSLPWLSRLSITYNPYVATEALAREIVPDPDRTDWTVAYHVIWPHGMGADPYNRYNRRPYTWIVCPGNVIISVPVEAVRNGWVYCPDGNLPDRRRNPNLPTIADALPRRPPPTGWMGPRERPAGARGETLDRLGRRPTPPERSDSTDLRLPWRRPVPAIDLGVVEGRPRIDLDRPEAGQERPVTPARPEAETARTAPSRPERTQARPETRSPRTVPPRATPRPGSRPSEPASSSRPESTPRTVPTRPVPTRPTATPARETPARPQARPSRPTPAPAKTKPASRPTTSSRPSAGSRPVARPAPKPASRPAPPPRPKSKKPKGGGG